MFNQATNGKGAPCHLSSDHCAFPRSSNRFRKNRARFPARTSPVTQMQHVACSDHDSRKSAGEPKLVQQGVGVSSITFRINCRIRPPAASSLFPASSPIRGGGPITLSSFVAFQSIVYPYIRISLDDFHRVRAYRSSR